MTAYEVVVVDFSEEADPLAVASSGVGQIQLHSHPPHFRFGQVADREHRVAQLAITYARQKIGLILDRIGRRGKIYESVGRVGQRACIMPRGRIVKLVAAALLEVAELDEPVAHYVGIGSQSLTDRAEGILHDAFPVFLVEIDRVERQAIARRDQTAHLEIFLGRAVAAAVVGRDTDIEQADVVALLHQPVDSHGAVDAT